MALIDILDGTIYHLRMLSSIIYNIVYLRCIELACVHTMRFPFHVLQCVCTQAKKYCLAQCDAVSNSGWALPFPRVLLAYSPLRVHKKNPRCPLSACMNRVTHPAFRFSPVPMSELLACFAVNFQRVDGSSPRDGKTTSPDPSYIFYWGPPPHLPTYHI